MSGWYSIRVCRAEQLKTEQLLGELREVLRAADPDAGVFSVQVNDQVVDIYLSPSIADKAGKVIHRYWGAECGPPPVTAKHILGSAAALTTIPPQTK